jgi:putative DNA primase/helicase
MIFDKEELNKKLDDIAKLEAFEYESQRDTLLKELGWKRPKVLDDERKDRRAKLCPEEQVEGELAGKAVKLVDVAPWDTPVRLSALLDEIAGVLESYIIFPHPYDSWTLALWVVVTYCTEIYNIAPQVGVTALSPQCGKTSLLRILLHLVRKGKVATSATRSTIFRTIDMYAPLTLVCDEIDKWVADDPQLLCIFLQGHEREFAWVDVAVGEDHEPRSFFVFGTKVWGQIGKPDEQLVSRSIMIQLLQKRPDQFVLDWPRIGMPVQLSEMFLRLQRQCLRWVKDNTEKIKANMPQLSTLSNRVKDNWYPLYCIACMASDVWKERALQGANAETVIEEPTNQIVLLRDIRNAFHTRGVDVLPSWLLLKDLLLQPESPWKDYERQKDGLNSHQLGRMIRDFGIRSETIAFDSQLALFPKDGAEKTKLKGYKRSFFETLIDSHLAGVKPETIPVFDGAMFEAERLKLAKEQEWATRKRAA